MIDAVVEVVAQPAVTNRLADNLRHRRGTGLAAILNRAVNETLPRTLLTGGTALATLAALAVFGGEVIRPFAVVMFFGIFTGTFSSIGSGSSPGSASSG